LYVSCDFPCFCPSIIKDFRRHCTWHLTCHTKCALTFFQMSKKTLFSYSESKHFVDYFDHGAGCVLYPLKDQVCIQCTQKILVSFLRSHFWLDVHEIWTQCVNMYFLAKNYFFFQSGAWIKSYVALNFWAVWTIWESFGKLLQKSSLTFEIWHVYN